MDSGAPSGDTLAGDTVVIQVPPDGPYGVNLRPDENGNAAVVHSFDKLPNGKFGPIQKHGGIHYGDVLCEINDVNLSSVSHAEALQMLGNRNTLKKILKFQSPKVYYRKKNTASVRALPADSKNSFLSAVKRSRLSEEGAKKFTEYEIACQYRLVGFKVQTEVVYQWSVWKRYSEFEALHQALKKSLGWQMDGIEFPSAHTFVMNKLSPEFVEQRREDLKNYWQMVVGIDKVVDFGKHHCSAEIKAFLQVDENTRNKEVAAAADMLPDPNEPDNTDTSVVSAGGAGPTASAAPARRGSVRMNSRRISTKSLAAVNTINISDPTPSAALAITNAPSSPTPASSASASATGPVAMDMSPAPAPTPAATAPTAARASPPPPPPRPTPAPAPVTAPAPAPVAASAPAQPAGIPAKTPARANLLSSINALRKD